MKKSLLIITMLWLPFLLSAQIMDTATTFYENFDGATIALTPSGTGGGWSLTTTLAKSAPNSYHTPVYSASGNSSATTEPIPLTSSEVNTVNRVYFAFDHICKVNPLVNATIYYAVANGYDEDGELAWGAWQMLNFNAPGSDFYLGSGSYTAGKFNDQAYSTWQNSSMSAVPTNAWWKHEYFDLTSMVMQPGATHFKLQFRCNNTMGNSMTACAGWYVDNLQIILSNCELVLPEIVLTNPVYVNTNTNMRNNIGPYVIHATISDNDTINLNSLVFTYELNDQPTTTVPNTIVTNNLNNGHSVTATWDLPTMCYYDTIRYHIYVEDTHGSAMRLDTPMVAWHNQTNIQQNDCCLDSLNTFPHCFITSVAEPVTLYFKNKSDAIHSPNSNYQTGLSVTFKVENENHVVTHNSTHTWTGSLCFDERDALSLGNFTPTRGFNYITVYVNTRNGQADGNHANDTLRFTGFACDSLLNGDYTVGGANADFPDMSAVKAALSYCGINGPVRFHLRPGTYQDFDFQEHYVGQSATNTVTFEGDNVNTVIVTNNHSDSGTNLYGAVTLINVNDFVFKNLTIQGDNNATSRGVLARGDGSTNIMFDGCKITAHTTNNTATTSFCAGRTVAANTTPDEITFNNCAFVGGNFGVYYYGSNARKNNVTVTNSTVRSCYRGIYTYYSNPLIRNNHISQYNMTSHQNFSGIYVDGAVGVDIDGNTIDSTYDAEYGIYLKNATNADFYIRNNHVKVGNSNFGVYVNGSSSTATVTGYVYNNEVILYPVVATASYAMKIENSNLLEVTNNSFFIKSNAPYSNTAALYIQNNNNTYLNNNILYNRCNCTDNTDYPLYLLNTSTVTGSYNNLFSASGVVAFKTVARNSIAEFEAAVTTATNNVSLWPMIEDPTQSLLPMDFTGTECARVDPVMTDIRGIARYALTYMGAYANQIAQTDASVVAMTSPSLGTCPQGTYNITVEVANKGAEALNFAAHPATITVHSDSLNLHNTVTVNSGTIDILGSMPQVVATNVAVPVNQMIDFKFIIRTTGDNNYLNDTLTVFFVMEAAIPYYDEDFSGGTKQNWTIQQLAGAGNWSFQEGTGTAPEIAPVYGTGRLFFNARSFSNTTESRVIMPVVVLNGAVNPIMEMWFAHDNGYSSSSISNTEGVTVKISTDGGNTFTEMVPEGQTAALVKRYLASATTPEWRLYTYDLSDYISAGCVYIAFDARSRAGNNINIDRIRLRNLLDNDLSVTNIYSQGETPAQYGMKNVVKALVRNEGRQTQTNAEVYLTVEGVTETYRDTVTIASLASNAETIVVFEDHAYNTQEVKNVEVRSRDDQNNTNNSYNWRMDVTNDIANYADTSAFGLLTGDYNALIRPCVRYQTREELAVKAVKYYYDYSYIANPEQGFRAFVSNAAGEIVATSDVIDFNTLQRHAWNIIPINNFALTNMQDEFYVGIEMLANGDYLCSQIESPLRDSTFYYLQTNGTYAPQTFGRFMIGAQVDTPFVQDFAILNLQNPTSRCDLGHEQITIEITNNGASDIEAGSVLHYRVNNNPEVTQTFASALPSHVTTQFVFDTDFDFTNNAVDTDVPYNVSVWVTKLGQDRLQYNDTLNVVVVSRGKSAMPMVTSPVNVPYHTAGTLTAQLPASITQGVIGWYASTGYESWDLLGYGDSYTTPMIFFDTVFYANANPGTLYDTVVGTGTQTGSQPFIFTSGFSKGRILYLEEEIGHHGPITSIAVYVTTPAGAAASQGIPIKLYLKETNLASFPTTVAIDWNSELSGATLVVDEQIYFGQSGWYFFNLMNPFEYTGGNLEVITETNCADYCTGSGSQCNNCGQYVSGAASYPVFQMSTVANGFVQYKNGNSATMTGNYTNFTKRLNMRFKIADLECGSEKVPIVIHVPDIPDYDVETQEMVYPTGGCALDDEEHIQVTIKNLLNQPIPANKVVVHAVFNGTAISHTIDEPFAAEEVKTVTFTQPIDLSAPTANVAYNYTIYTTMPDETVVYRGNDTITGVLNSTYTAHVPDVIDYTGAYTQPFTLLQPQDRPANITLYYFYHNADDATPFHTSTTAVPTYTTPALYDTITYWVSGKTQTSNCETQRIQVNVNVFTPQYDLITNELVAPTSYQCGVANSPQIQVNVGNTDTTASSVIPAGTFNLTAQFTGTNTATGTTVVNTPISSLQNSTITFANGINIGSTTQNNAYTYTIYSNPTDANMGVYRGNDTITGRLYIPANPTAPQPITVTAPYGMPYTVAPTGSVLDYYYFYDSNAANAEPIAQGASFETEPLYAPATYYYSGRIEDDDFDTLMQIGTGTSSQTYPFTFTNGHSYGKMLYSAAEMGVYAGRIDTMFVSVQTANTSGSSIPVKMWMKNGTDAAQLTTATSVNVNWDTETASATKVFDGELYFDQVGWLAIPILGGFDYTGGALYLYVEHNCGDASCVTNNGINPVPKFNNTSIQKKVACKAQNTEISGSTSFSIQNNRWNTRFKMNYTCESPKSMITVNTSVPAHDVAVIAINTPVAQSNTFTANETVSVVVKNFGSQTATSIPVKYQLDNDAPVSQTVNSLAAGATTTVNFTTTCDLSGIYFNTPFKAYTDLANDDFRGNDTVSIFLSKEDPCISRPLSVATGADISNVTFSDINNGPGTPYYNYNPAPNDGLYTDYTQTVAPAELILGQTYDLSVTHSFTTATGATVYKTAYIDYDRNGVFEASEQIFTSGAISSDPNNATTTSSIAIPTTAQVGLTRMRVICAAGNWTNACGTYNYAGETEDYAVLLSSPLPTDLGIVAYQHPVGDICPDTSGRIRVMIKNYGSATQSFSVTNPVEVTATVTGAANGTYTTSIVSGSLQPGEQQMVVLDGVDYSGIGTYNVSTTLTYNGDQYDENNTKTVTASTASLNNYIALPFVENFDQNTGTDELHFTSDWEVANSNANYKWIVNQGASTNSVNNGGPEGDHTYANNPTVAQYGRFATIPGTNSNYNTTNPAWSTLTSRCLNMHYQNGYPVEVELYKFFMGAANADFEMTVEVGSGSHYIPFDTLTKADGGQTFTSDPWTSAVIPLVGYDEVGRLRFKLTKQKYRIDPSIDDINVNYGLPDLAVESIEYPYDFRDSIEHPNACLQFNDTIYPSVVLKNNGYSPIPAYDVMCILSVGNVTDTIIEHVSTSIAAGESYTHTFEHGFVVPENVFYCQLMFYGIVENDKEPLNDMRRVISCAAVDLPSYEAEKGVVLNQNMPNPASDQTVIVYLVPDFGEATLNIYSAMGQLLQTVSQNASMGQNRVEINTSNLSAGVYYYTLNFKETTLTKKMVIQK